MYYLFVFRSLTYAQSGAKVLSGTGIRAGLVRTPKGVSDEGCSHSLRVPQNESKRAIDLLRRTGIPPKRIFMATGDAGFKEVTL